MTNKIAIVLAVLILITIATIAVLYGQAPFIFLGKRLLDLINWIAFWR